MRILKNTLGLPAFLLVLQLGLSQAAQAGDGNAWNCDKQVVSETPIAGEAGAAGQATLCSTPWGLFANMRVRNLTAGNAYTVWWVYFDNAADCVEGDRILAPTACGALENWGPNEAIDNSPLAVFGRMDAVVPTHSREHFSGQIRDFIPSSGSQVLLLIFGHGTADYVDGQHLARQLLTPEDPAAGFPHLGIEPNGYPVAVAVYTIP